MARTAQSIYEETKRRSNRNTKAEKELARNRQLKDRVMNEGAHNSIHHKPALGIALQATPPRYTHTELALKLMLVLLGLYPTPERSLEGAVMPANSNGIYGHQGQEQVAVFVSPKVTDNLHRSAVQN